MGSGGTVGPWRPAAIAARRPVARDGIYVVPVLNQHGVPVAIVSSFDANFSCGACDCGQPQGFVYAKTVESLKAGTAKIYHRRFARENDFERCF